MIPSIANLVADKLSCGLRFVCRNRIGFSSETTRDFYDGTTYKKQPDRYGEENMSNDILLAISRDGLRPF